MCGVFLKVFFDADDDGRGKSSGGGAVKERLQTQPSYLSHCEATRGVSFPMKIKSKCAIL